MNPWKEYLDRLIVQLEHTSKRCCDIHAAKLDMTMEQHFWILRLRKHCAHKPSHIVIDPHTQKKIDLFLESWR